MKRIYRTLSALLVTALSLTACGGGGGGGGSAIPTVTPTPFQGGSPPPTTSAACPSSGSAPSSAAIGTIGTEATVRRTPPATHEQRFVPGMLAVTYTTRAVRAKAGDLEFDALGLRTRAMNVGSSGVESAIAKLRATPGVQSVSRVAYRQRMVVASNDPYFVGFGGGAPYFQTSSTAGQWDMHAISVLTGWNDVASAPPVTGAPIAIVDTGVDVTHPELAGGKIVRTQCFVTFPNGTSQTNTPFVTDTDGHGTNVAGIADADTNNGFGFASPAFGAHLLAYRIFPSDPTTGCPPGANNPQCDSNTLDEAAAINDAVAHGAKVINLSLGAPGPCSSSDAEYQAVENAIAHNVVVVAAAGNGNDQGIGQPALTCPAADPGVIAVGATGLDDSGSSIKEVVTTYSNYLTTTGGGRYLVAPGGNPSGSSDNDNLHWIENIYSSTAEGVKSCTPDFNSTSSTPDCRILIAGTSQAAPHVAGAASLILAVRPSYTPAQVATALCASASGIGDSKQGCGRLNVGAAVSYAKSH